MINWRDPKKELPEWDEDFLYVDTLGEFVQWRFKPSEERRMSCVVGWVPMEEINMPEFKE